MNPQVEQKQNFPYHLHIKFSREAVKVVKVGDDWYSWFLQQFCFKFCLKNVY